MRSVTWQGLGIAEYVCMHPWNGEWGYSLAGSLNVKDL